MAKQLYNPLLKLGLQELQDIPEPPAPIVIDDEFSPTSTNPVQNKVITNKINEITSDSIDINVTTLAEFVAAVERSADVSVRIHLRADISLTEDLTVNLDNCQIYGHDNRIYLENNTFLIQGEYCYFYQVRFNASSLVTAYHANQSDYFDARIKIVSTAASCRFFFEYVVFMNFICHSYDKQHTIIEVDGPASGSPSLHTYFLYCEVMTNNLNDNLPRINDCVWSIENVGNNLHCLTAKIIDYWSQGYDGTNYDSTKNFNFCGNSLQGYAKLGFTSDASINYASSPSGYTSLTPNAVNIYNPSSEQFNTLYNYVHGNNFATYAQGVKADNALQSISKGTDGEYITTTVTPKASNQQSVSSSLTMQAVATAGADHKGITEASDVKNYIDTGLKSLSEQVLTENYLAYGVEWSLTTGDPTCTRIGNAALHQSLPIQSAMVGGVLDDAGNFTPFDDIADWTQASQKRDGTDGQVMVYVPSFYIRFITLYDKLQVWVSQYPLTGFIQVGNFCWGAHEATLQRSTLKLSDVVSMDPDYRGGNNNSSWDNTYRSLLGMPATYISLDDFRAYARNRWGNYAGNAHRYDYYKWLVWLWVVEYATLNFQTAFNSALDANGYHQGGMGPGVTTWTDTAWGNYNSYYPLVPCGVTDTLGNGSGVVAHSVKDADNNTLITFDVPRWRGIENFFGHIWKWTDGVLVDFASVPNHPQIMTSNNAADFGDMAKYTNIGEQATTQNYITKITYGEGGDITAKVVGGSSTSYYCDYFWSNNDFTQNTRGLLFGGSADSGAGAGAFYSHSHRVPAHVSAPIGSRLCYTPPAPS